MKTDKPVDIILICMISIFLSSFVCMRVMMKEVLIDKLNISFPGMEYILYDLNTTIEIPETMDNENDKNKWEKRIERYQYKLTAYTTSAMIFNQKIHAIVDKLDKKLVNIPTTYSSIRYVSVPSKNVIGFAETLQKRNIPFAYVSTPCYDSILCRKGNGVSFENRLSECSWYMLRNLKEAGIDTIDLAEKLAEVDPIYYDTSMHWFPEYALYSAMIVGEFMNQYGFDFDSSCFDLKNTWDYFEEKEEWRKLIYDTCGYEYSFPIPGCTEGMEFTLEHEGAIREGKFEEVFLKVPNEYASEAYHGFSVVGNATLHKYHNKNSRNNKGKRVLIIGDSFNWILSDYLSIDIEYIDVIHNASFTSGIGDYINETEPDMVLVIYNDAEFVEIYTEQAYKFD